MKQFKHSIAYIALIFFAFTSCKTTRYLEDGQILLSSSKVIIEGKDNNIIDKNSFKNDLKSVAVQKPNKKLLGFLNLKLGFYNLAVKRRNKREEKGKTPVATRFNKWMADKVGESPAIFDSTVVEFSEERMKNYLNNSGYFNSEVKSDYAVSKKRAKVIYYAKPKEVYYINKVNFTAEDSIINEIINREEYTLNSELKEEDPYNAKNIKRERARISEVLRDEGYFTFNQGYVFFAIDSNLAGNKVDIYTEIRNPVDEIDNLHKKYYIGNVYFNINKPISAKDDLSKVDTTNLRNIDVILTKKDIKPDAIVQSIFFDVDSLYSKKNHDQTLKRLNALGIFKFVNVRFEPYQVAIDEGVLDTYISSRFNKKQRASIDLEGNTDSQNSLGLELGLNYINRNTFKRADRMQFTVSGGLEFQFRRENEEGVSESFINTVNLDSDLKFIFPKLLIPLKKNKEFKPYPYNRYTSFNLNYNFEKRVNFYSINKATFSYGYDWYKTNKIRHVLYPFTLSLVRPNEKNFTSQFEETLNRFPSLRRSFEQQFISGIDYTFTYNSQVLNSDRNVFLFKGNAKLSGNALHGLLKGVSKQETTPFKILNIPFSQFARFESDVRYYYNLKKPHSFVMRFVAGVGIPYGNSSLLPYVEQFYGGGNQSLRAWRFKTIGPGSFNTDSLGNSLLDQTGDIKLEVNAEFRFSIVKFLKAALFADAGNVWLLRKDEDKPNGEFAINRFGKEIALGAGIGIRLDFNYFIIRFDAAIPLHDPIDGWVINDFSLRKGTSYRDRLGFNIAIGYPF